MNETMTVQLTRGFEASVSAEDFAKVSQYKWHASVQKNRDVIYARRNRPRKEGRGTIFMHRFITDAPDGMVVDHRDHDGLNNTRKNLHVCTNAENLHNAGTRRSRHEQGMKGAILDKNRPNALRKWTARIKIKGRNLYLGRFETPEQAAAAYDRAALARYGEFAQLNRELLPKSLGADTEPRFERSAPGAPTAGRESVP